MITEQDLQAAIAECQGERNPNANTCIKLASYYILREKMYGTDEPPETGYSYASADSNIAINETSDFASVVNGQDFTEIFPVLDELMSTLEVLHPKLYASVMQRLDNLKRL